MTAQLQIPGLMSYRVRISNRARRPSVTVCLYEGIVVTIPRGFDEARVPRLLADWRPWLERQIRSAEQRRDRLPADALDEIPRSIRLAAIGERWQVDYRSTDGNSVRVSESLERLRVSGPVANLQACRQALRRWLSRRARSELRPWLDELATRHGFAYRKLAIRGQRSRWGSYSTSGTLSLNYLLLFLEPELVRCVLLHELCHTRYMSHGPRFHALLARLEPRYRELDARINEAWHVLPGWAWRQ